MKSNFRLCYQKTLTIAEMIALLMLSSCTLLNNGAAPPQASQQFTYSKLDTFLEKLRVHFSGKSVGDLSELIQQAKAFSRDLKAHNNVAEANKMDSYIDVLMYGNRTIDESIDDVMMLVKNGHHHNIDQSKRPCRKQPSASLPYNVFGLFGN